MTLVKIILLKLLMMPLLMLINNSNSENLKKSEPSILNNITHVDNFIFNLNKIQTFSSKSFASDVLDQLSLKQQIASWAVNEHISDTSLKSLLSRYIKKTTLVIQIYLQTLELY